MFNLQTYVNDWTCCSKSLFKDKFACNLVIRAVVDYEYE